MGRGLLVLVSAICALAFILVLFSDFLPLPFGGYADQRFFLVAAAGLLAVVPGIFFALKPAVAPKVIMDRHSVGLIMDRH